MAMSSLSEYLKSPPAFIPAVVGYLVKDNQVLLGLRKKVSLGLGNQLISGIGGKLEEGETEKEALKRELLEEIGVEIKDFKFMGRVKFIFPNKPKWNQEVSAFIITRWQGKPTETEVIKPIWFSINNLPKHQMWEDNLIWTPKVLAGKKVNAVFLYDESQHVAEYCFTPLPVTL